MDAVKFSTTMFQMGNNTGIELPATSLARGDLGGDRHRRFLWRAGVQADRAGESAQLGPRRVAPARFGTRSWFDIEVCPK